MDDDDVAVWPIAAWCIGGAVAVFLAVAAVVAFL